MKRVCLLFLSLSLVACSSLQFPLHARTLEAAPLPKPAKDKALVVFIRPEEVAQDYESRIYDGDKLIGIVFGNTYMYYQAVPGRHIFGALNQFVNMGHANYYLLDSDLVAGRTYFVYIHMYGPSYPPPDREDRDLRSVVLTYNVIVLDVILPGSENWDNLEVWLNSTRRTEMLDKAFIWEQKNIREVDEIRKRTMEEWVKRSNNKMIRPTDGV